MTADCLSTPTNRKKMFPPSHRSGAVLLGAPVPLPEVEAEEDSLVVAVEVEPPVEEARGRSSAQGQQGEREVGSASGNDSNHQQEADSDVNEAQFLLNNLEDSADYYSYVHPAIDHLVATSSIQDDAPL
jgi:hypothetical protein